MGWLDKLLGAKTALPDTTSPSTGFFDVEVQPQSLDLVDRDIRAVRQQVRDAAQQVASSYGIPNGWLSYEVLTISDDKQAFFQLQINLLVWDEQLWQQSMAFEQQVMKHLRSKDVHIARAVRAVLWRVLPDAGCPYDELSSEEAWQPEAVRQRSKAYERVRREFAPSAAAAAAIGFAHESTAANSTIRLSELDVFVDTYTPEAGGFAATQPHDPKDSKVRS